MNYQFEVLTVRDINFEDPNGRAVNGYQLWLIGATTEPEWHGYEVLKLWIGAGTALEATVHQLKKGDQINVAFNRRGKAESIYIL